MVSLDKTSKSNYNYGMNSKKEQMMKLYIWTQDQENYGAHDWDGKGECPQYWKAKGGEDFFIVNFKGGDYDATIAVMALRSQIEENSNYFRREVMGWELVANDYMTDFEKSQFEHEGQIRFKAKELAW
jgi:hypothetical protein